MATPLQTGTKDVSLVVWIGVIGLLFLAVAVHEGWFSSGSAGSNSGGDGQGTGATGDYGDTGFESVNSLSSFWNYLTTF